MREFKITDGVYVIIERARSETQARRSACARLGCDDDSLRVIRTKKQPPTWRERKQEAVDLQYAEWLMQLQLKEERRPEAM